MGKISLDDDFDAHLEKAKNLFVTANKLKVKNIRMFSFYPHENQDFSKSENEVFEKLDKQDLFKYVSKNGAFPRKTFSMGEGVEKRYYLEGRRITK